MIGNIKKRTYPTETWALSDQIMEREIITNKMISNESNSASSCLVKQKSESDLSNKSSRQAFLKVKFTKVPLPKRHLTENVTCKDLLKHK